MNTLAKGVREGGLYKLFVDPVVCAHSSEMMDEPSSFQELGENAWWDAVEISSKPMMDSMIDSKFEG